MTKLTSEQSGALWRKASQIAALNPEQRTGQVYMNALWDINRELYIEISGTDDDPFYRDDRLPSFLRRIID